MNGPCCIAVRPFLMDYVLSCLSSVCPRFDTAANEQTSDDGCARCYKEKLMRQANDNPVFQE
ncbi:MAG: hypothetical protein QOH35_1117 [Acidobacteriaceae bacterium]|jgi:hypothetical protein|nr:hypothetical protein [Acidobacteriaceae bacterium]